MYGPLDKAAMAHFMDGSWDSASLNVKAQYEFFVFDILKCLEKENLADAVLENNLLGTRVHVTSEGFARWVMDLYNEEFEESYSRNADGSDEAESSTGSENDLGSGKPVKKQKIMEFKQLLMNYRDSVASVRTTEVGTEWDEAINMMAKQRKAKKVAAKSAAALNVFGDEGGNIAVERCIVDMVPVDDF